MFAITRLVLEFFAGVESAENVGKPLTKVGSRTRKSRAPPVSGRGQHH